MRGWRSNDALRISHLADLALRLRILVCRDTADIFIPEEISRTRNSYNDLAFNHFEARSLLLVARCPACGLR
jgi:hypothetical protein